MNLRLRWTRGQPPAGDEHDNTQHQQPGSAPAKRHVVQLSYLTARGRWYDVSWKGVDERSGGIVINIGIHFFDLLVWLFGPVERAEVHLREGKRAAGTMALQHADVQWYLSAEASDLPFTPVPGGKTTFRSIVVDGEQLEFSEGFTDLHTRVYEEVLAGRPDLVPPVTARALLMEERRLFYVACTRARRRLVVSAVQSPDDDGEQPSRFLEELGVTIERGTKIQGS